MLDRKLHCPFRFWTRFVATVAWLLLVRGSVLRPPMRRKLCRSSLCALYHVKSTQTRNLESGLLLQSGCTGWLHTLRGCGVRLPLAVAGCCLRAAALLSRRKPATCSRNGMWTRRQEHAPASGAQAQWQRVWSAGGTRRSSAWANTSNGSPWQSQNQRQVAWLFYDRPRMRNSSEHSQRHSAPLFRRRGHGALRRLDRARKVRRSAREGERCVAAVSSRLRLRLDRVCWRG